MIGRIFKEQKKCDKRNENLMKGLGDKVKQISRKAKETEEDSESRMEARTEGDFARGDGWTAQCAHVVLLSRALEACMVLPPVSPRYI